MFKMNVKFPKFQFEVEGWDKLTGRFVCRRLGVIDPDCFPGHAVLSIRQIGGKSDSIEEARLRGCRQSIFRLPPKYLPEYARKIGASFSVYMSSPTTIVSFIDADG